jgi:hypothetical protein
MSRPWDPYAPASSSTGPAAPQLLSEPSGDDLDTLTKAQLIERAGLAGLSTSGTKPELIERLRGR